MRKLSVITTALFAGLAVFAADLSSDGSDGASSGGLIRSADAQEIQITGPLAGAPAVRRLRLHRDGRFDIAPHATFTLLDEFRRGIMPGLRLNYHFYDWLGVGVFGGYVLTYNTGLSDELQEKAINQRNCAANPNALSCKRTAVNLCQGEDCLADTQLGRMTFYVAPQITVVPFRGKFSLFGSAFLDSDISLFLGPAIIGLEERKSCENGSCPDTFELETRVTATATFGFGLNFYPVWQGDDGTTQSFIGFGTELRLSPFAWNTAGFDSAGAGEDDAFPDDQINDDDQAVLTNPMLSVYISFQLPTGVELSD